jgi:hypothetical protein
MTRERESVFDGRQEENKLKVLNEIEHFLWPSSLNNVKTYETRETAKTFAFE